MLLPYQGFETEAEEFSPSLLRRVIIKCWKSIDKLVLNWEFLFDTQVKKKYLKSERG